MFKHLKTIFAVTAIVIFFWWFATSSLFVLTPNGFYVTAITDGDTIKVLKDHQEIKIRLAHIDAPESKQAFGTRAKQALADKVFNKYVDLEITGHDRYGRTIAVIVYRGRNINLEMVREGWAWHYKQFSKEASYEVAMQEAKEKGLGLWTDKHPIPPWEFRSR